MKRLVLAAAVAAVVAVATSSGAAAGENKCKAIPIDRSTSGAGSKDLSDNDLYCAAAFIRLNGYACSRVVSAFGPGGFRNTLRLRCENNYRYTIADRGGNFVVTLD